MEKSVFANEKSSFTFILISDLHMNHKKLEKLKSWYFSFLEEKIDFVFALGDFDNLKNPCSRQDQIDSEARISNILCFLEFFACPIIYLPGNHDPDTLFQIEEEINPTELKKLTQHSVNLHKRKLEIANDLQIVGFGGSIPIFSRLSNPPKTIYEGYPYNSDKELEKDLSKISYFFKKEIFTILITHNGPEESSTTLDTTHKTDNVQDTLYSGSKALAELIMNEENSVLLNIHGHTHGGAGKINMGKTAIINPGSLSVGEFSKLKIEKSAGKENWLIKNIEFINLNAF